MTGPSVPQQPLDPAAQIRRMYGSRRAIADTTIPPVLFVTTNGFLGLKAAAAAAVAYGLGTASYRLAKGQDTRQALVGLGGLAFALAIALRTGRASTYFVPNVISGLVIAAVALLTVAFRRPASAYLALVFEGKPKEHYYAPGRVRATHMMVTAAWGTWFLVRSSIRGVLILQDRPEALGVTAVTFGAPATLGLALASFAFIRWRLQGESTDGAAEPQPDEPGG